MDLIEIMQKKAKKDAKIIICEGWDERVIKAADKFLKHDYGKIILVGKEEKIRINAKRLGADISKAQLLDPDEYDKTEMIQELSRLRKHKGVDEKKAAELIGDVNYFGCMYVLLGKADAVGSSAICPTSDIMRPALQLLRKKDCLVSEIAVMSNPEMRLFMTDCSLNVNPDEDELLNMALNASECVKEFGIRPKIAMVSYSTYGSGGDGDDLKLIRNVIKRARKIDDRMIIDGEFQMDAALNRKAAEKKCPDSVLKGDANTLVYPNLMAANIFCHGIMQVSDWTFDFTVMKGLKRPVGILGRSSPLETVYKMLLSLSMQSDL